MKSLEEMKQEATQEFDRQVAQLFTNDPTMNCRKATAALSCKYMDDTILRSVRASSSSKAFTTSDLRSLLLIRSSEAGERSTREIGAGENRDSPGGCRGPRESGIPPQICDLKVPHQSTGKVLGSTRNECFLRDERDAIGINGCSFYHGVSWNMRKPAHKNNSSACIADCARRKSEKTKPPGRRFARIRHNLQL